MELKKRINRKGFTLVELLAVIVVLSLLVGLSVFGIISVINNSKMRSKVITESTLLEAARIYSGEADSESWKSTGDYDVFCVTVGELVNKGFIDREADVNKDDFVIVRRNKVSLSLFSEEMANHGSENYNICTGQSFNESEMITYPTARSSSRYTDKLVINFTPGSAIYKEGESETISTVSYSCLYGDSSSNINKRGNIEDNKCILNNLKNDKDYYVMIYMDTSHGSTVLASGNNNFTTSNFRNTSMNSTSTGVKITFYDTDSSGNSINSPSYYFKSTVSGNTDVSVKNCTLRNDVFNCDDSSTNSIVSDTWYKTDSTTVNINFSIANGSTLLTTRVYDGSNNFKQNENNFTLKTINVKFYKGSADSIGGITSEYIERSCLAVTSGSASSCYITSPTIMRDGWESVGWATSSSALLSSWEIRKPKSFTEDATYYAITKKKITVLFESNGATSIGSSSQSCDMYNSSTSCNITSPTITRSGFTITGWGDSADSTSNLWDPNTSSEVSFDTTYYAITSKKVTVSFNSNGATSIGSESQSCTIQNSSTSCSITSPTITREGFTITGWGDSADATSSSWNPNTSSEVSFDTTYYAITSKKVTISFDKNGATSIGNTSQSCTIQNSSTSCSVTSPTITREGFDITGWGDSADSKSSLWDVSKSENVTDDTTYYAVTSKEVTLSFDGNGGTAGSSSKNCTIYNDNSSCKIKMPSASRSEYSFAGWGTSSDSSSSSYSSDNDYDFDSDKKLYAIWQASCSGNSGQKEFNTTGDNGFKGRLSWKTTCNSDGTINFDITDLEFYSTYTFGYTFYLDGYIKVNDHEAKWCNSKASGEFVTVHFTNTKTWYSIETNPDFKTVKLPNGTKKVTIKFEKYNFSSFAGLYGKRVFWIKDNITINL